MLSGFCAHHQGLQIILLKCHHYRAQFNLLLCTNGTVLPAIVSNLIFAMTGCHTNNQKKYLKLTTAGHLKEIISFKSFENTPFKFYKLNKKNWLYN